MPPVIPKAVLAPQESHQRLLLKRFGKTVLREGYTCIPNLLMRYQAELMINPTQLNIIVQIWMSWWDRYPFPAIRTIADRMHRGQRCVQVNLRRLEKPLYDEDGKKLRDSLISIRARSHESGGSLTNEYDFTPLLKALEKLTRRGGGESRFTGGMNPDSPGGESRFTRGMNLDSPGGMNLDSPNKDKYRKRLKDKDESYLAEKKSSLQKTNLTPEQESLYAIFDQLYGNLNGSSMRVIRNQRNLDAIDQLIACEASIDSIRDVFKDIWDDPENNHWWRKHLTISALASQYATRLAVLKTKQNGKPRDAPTPTMSPDERLARDLARWNRDCARRGEPALTIDEFRQLLEQTRKGANPHGTS